MSRFDEAEFLPLGVRAEWWEFRLFFCPLPWKEVSMTRICELCNGPLGNRNTTGVCTKTPECKRENRHRMNAKRKDAMRDWYEANSERVKEANISRRKANHHDELTYLMWSPGLNSHKIGITVNLNYRMRELSNGCWDIELVTTFPYGRELEKWLHHYFAAHRITGTEWFTDITEVDVKNAVIEYEELAA